MKFLKYFLLFSVLIMGGCDFLNLNHEDFLSSTNVVLSDFIHSRQMLTAIYSDLPGGFNEVSGSMLASATDDAVEANSSASIKTFYNGSWSPIETIDAQWEHYYSAIRKANIFIQNFDTVKVLKSIKFQKNFEGKRENLLYFLPQARFLRAFFYFELFKRYGGNIPLVTKPLSRKEANSVETSTKKKIVNFIVSECNAIVNKLPVSYKNVPDKETGRATKGAVMALKARTLLYAASPLFNPSNDKSKWENAAKASAAIIDSSWYSLEPNYNDAFNNFTSTGLILGRGLAPSNSFERANYPVGYEGARPGTCPTENLVEAYMMSNGKSIHDPGSGYDPNHPYKNRDPRLKETIIVNNSIWKGRKVQTWRGGKDGPPKFLATPTGYYLKKYVYENVNTTANNPTTKAHLWVYFGYDEVLLNYAEAMNEAFGPTTDPKGFAHGMTAYEAVKKIRSRVNMPGFASGMNKSQFRTAIHNERRVELAFENQRFWDIRRWKIGPSTTNIYGMKILKNPNGSFSYNKILINKRNWSDKMYFFPIPEREININQNLKQSPDW